MLFVACGFNRIRVGPSRYGMERRRRRPPSTMQSMVGTEMRSLGSLTRTRLRLLLLCDYIRWRRSPSVRQFDPKSWVGFVLGHNLVVLRDQALNG